jgi:membrane fusion protein, copper/silver efflux system
MKRINISTNKKWLRYLLILVFGLFLGWIFFHGSGGNNAATTEMKNVKKQWWTCSMHPQIRLDHPGKCPICGMDLIPVKDNGNADSMKADANSIILSDEAVALANIQTTYVSMHNPNKAIRLFGKIQPDQRLQQSQAAYVGGRIERLFVNAVGDHVSKGQTLAVIYSPELYSAEQELVEALNFPDAVQRRNLVNAAKEKLSLWNLTPAQISVIVNRKKASPFVALKSNTTGTVINKSVNQGDYVNQGAVLFQVANLSRVWAVFQAYEDDLPFLKRGESLSFTAQAVPGKVFRGNVSFIDPVVDPNTRTAGVRVEVSNVGGMFKPEMFVTGVAHATLNRYEGRIVVPQSAVLWTGKRSVVYVKEQGMQQPTFEMRQVTLGPSLSGAYVILSGLREGDEIVTNGAFVVDASAQLAGKKSMMNQ